MTRTKFLQGIQNRLGTLVPYFILTLISIFTLFPVVLVFLSSFKNRKALFSEPLSLPTVDTFSLDGYARVFERANFPLYFRNSLIVTVASLFLIILIGALAAYALAEYDFRGRAFISFYLIMGIMIPIRLGTVGILRMMVTLKLVNTLAALVLVYTVAGLPISVFVLQQFFRQVPRDLLDAGRVDGASEYRIFWLILPIVRPAIATVAVFTLIPTWNDLWWPLILAPGEATKTVTLGATIFIGQYAIEWGPLLSALTLAMVPAMILYIIFSKQLVSGLTSGVVK